MLSASVDISVAMQNSVEELFELILAALSALDNGYEIRSLQHVCILVGECVCKNTTSGNMSTGLKEQTTCATTIN